MARRFWLACLFVSLFTCGSAFAHGGTYRGPGDTSPKPAPRPGDALPPRVGPSTIPGVAGTSDTPPQFLLEDPATTSSRMAWTLSGGAPSWPDLLRWQAWWNFNRDEFLDLKERLHTADVLAGSDEAFLGLRAHSLAELRPAPGDVFGTVNPALLELLERERSNEIVSGALIALAKIGDAPGRNELAPRIAAFLDDPNQEVAESAAIALGILGTPAQVELLREILEGDVEAQRRRGLELRSVPSERTRAFAAYGLGLVGQRNEGPVRERIVGVLGRWMREGRTPGMQDDLPVACVVALGLVPLPSDPFALPPLQVGPRPERLFSFEEQVGWMLATLDDENEELRVRAHVPVALARLFDSPQGRHCTSRRLATERIAARLRRGHADPVEVRTGCVIALGQLLSAGPEDADARALLRGVPSEFSDPVAACLALIALGRASCRPGFDAEPFAALEQGPEGTRTFLIGQLASANSSQRCYAALALGLLERGADRAGQERSEPVLAALRAALGRAVSPDELGACALALGLARDAAARGLLRESLERASDAESRGHVAVALGLVRDRASAGRLRELATSSRFQPELLRQAALGLGLLGDKEVVPLLFDMLTRAPSLSSQAAILSALGWIGDARSLAGLVAATRERERHTDVARAFAAVALGMCADKDQRPWNSRLANDANFRAVTSTLHSPDTGTGILDIL